MSTVLPIQKNKKVLALFPLDADRLQTKGLIKKALELVEAGQRSGLEVDYTWCKNKTVVTVHQHQSAKEVTFVLPKLIVRHFMMYIVVLQSLWRRKYSALWIRMGVVSPTLYLCVFLAKVRGVKVVIDIPTYPYKPTVPKSLQVLMTLTGNRMESSLLSMVDRIAAITDLKSLHSTPIIQVSNGCSVSAISTLESQDTLDAYVPSSKPYQMIGAGQWSSVHGIDRLFHGVEDLPVEIVLIGNGPSNQWLHKVAATISVPVSFKESVYGDDLIHEFTNASVGIGVLGSCNYGLRMTKPLKHLFYASRGIPFICDMSDETWKDCEGVLYLQNITEQGEGAKILEWLQRCERNREEYSRQLIDVAIQNMWDETYKSLFTYFNELPEPTM